MTHAESGRLGGLKNKGENNPNSKLTREVVEQIRRLRAEGFTCAWIGRLVGIHRSTASKLTTGKRWV